MKKKMIAVLLTLAMTLCALAGCGNTAAGETAEDVSNPVAEETPASAPESGDTKDEEVYTVKMYSYVFVDIPGNLDTIMEQVNKITMEELNMRLDLTLLDFTTASSQYPLMLSGGEEFDILTIVARWAPSFVDSGYLMNLSEYLPAVQADLDGSYGSGDVAYATIGDFVYGIPLHKDQCYQPTVFFATDILEKHDLVEEAKSITSLAELDAFFEKVAALEPDMWMTAPETGVRVKPVAYDGLGDMYGVVMDIENGKTIENLFETEEFKEYCTYMHKWFANNWVNQSAATDTESYYSYMKSGQAFSFFSDYSHPLSESDQEANCGGKDLTMVTIGPKYRSTESSFATTYAVPSSCRNPEKTLKMISFLANSPEINNLLNWGIEGEDYVVTEDGHADYPEGKDANSVNYHLDSGWILPNQFLCHPWAGNDSDIYDQIKAYNNTDVIYSPGLGLQWNSAAVANELTAVTAVKDKYFNELITGSVDPEEYIPIFNQELYDAGLQKIIDEKQAQLDAFLAQ